jgi:peptidoglycan hydrolase-like protein with peptidoglycan-binding domain
MSSFDQVIKNILSDLFGSNEQEDVVRPQARPSGLGAPTTSPRPRLRPEQDDDDEVAIPSGSEATSKFIAAMADYDDTPEQGVDIPLSTLQTDARNLNGKYKTTAMQLAKLNKAAPLTDGGRANVKVAGIEEDTTVQDLLSEIEMVMDPLSSVRPRARPLSNMEARAREIRAGTFTKKDRMKTIQEDLNAQGILINGKPLVIDGIQGGENSNTTKAIKAFQKREGLTVDGKVGPITREALLKYTVPESNITEEVLETVSAGRNEPRTERERIQAILDRDDFVESDFSLSAAEPTIVVSSNITKSKEEKKDVQRALIELGYEVGAVDGVIGSRTIKAIRQFQKDKKLNPDGTVGTNTAAAMNEALTESVSENSFVARVSTKNEVEGILDIDLSEPEEEKGYLEKARDLWSNFGTSEFRFFQNNLFSPGSTFTENNLNETDIETLREVVANAMQDGRTYVDYEPDYGIPESEVNKKSPAAGLTDRYLRMARTLGGFSFTKNEDGNIIIDNTFNYNKGPKREAYLAAIEAGEKLKALALLAKATPVQAASMIGYAKQEKLRKEGKPYETEMVIDLGKPDTWS